jgi:hypothetical protein
MALRTLELGMGTTSGAWIERYRPVSGDEDESQSEGEKKGSQKHVASLSAFTRYRNAAIVGFGTTATGSGSMETRISSAATGIRLIWSDIPGHSGIEGAKVFRHQAPISAA